MSKPTTKTTNVRRRMGHSPTPADLKEIADKAAARKMPRADTVKPTKAKKAKAAKAKSAKKGRAHRAAPKPGPRGESNIDRLLSYLREKPRTLDEISGKFDWLPHSARAAIVNAKAKLSGETIERVANGDRNEYTIQKAA